MKLPASSLLRFRPRLFDQLRGYDRESFARDLGAGLAVAVVALPLAMAFAIASGLKPEAGLFTANIGGFLISGLGGSRVQIGGPAGAFIVILYGILERYGLANLLIATMLAGVILLAMGALRLGTLVRYLPLPIVIGFTNGIAVLIALSQLKDFFGLSIPRMPGDFFGQVATLAQHAHTLRPAAVLLAAISLVFLFAWPHLIAALARRSPRRARLVGALPATVLVLVLATAAVRLLHLPVETIGSRFGGIPQSLPAFAWPHFDWVLVQQLLAPALTIALLGAIESLLCARVADSVIGDRHDPNQELMAQGLANLVSPLFGGMAATGTIARTMTNIRSGAVSPVAGMVHALALLLIVLVAAPLASSIPLAALAAILLFVAWNMGEWREFAHMRNFALSYRVQMLAAFGLTVVVDLTVAVQTGLVLACVFFIHRMASLSTVERLVRTDLPPAVRAFAMKGSLFFGAVDKLESLLDADAIAPHVLLLDLSQLLHMDASGLHALEGLLHDLQRGHHRLLLSGVQGQPRRIMENSGFLQRLGRDNCRDSVDQAIRSLAPQAQGGGLDGQAA